MRWTKGKAVVLTAFCALSLPGCTAEKQPPIEEAREQQTNLKPAQLPLPSTPSIVETIYVPVYSHIYHEDNVHKTLLACTLSMRNTDAKNELILNSIGYYDSDGKLLQEFCKTPMMLAPMATAEIVVPRTNTEGGSGANFLIKWSSGQKASEPIAEAVMISLGSAQSVSFVSRGVVTSRVEGNAVSVPKKKEKTGSVRVSGQ